MNKTYQELCDENQHLREGIRTAAAKLEAGEPRVTVTTDPDLQTLDQAIALSRTDRDDALGVAIKSLNAALLARNGRQRTEKEAVLAAHQDDLVRELSACQGVLHSLARSGEVTKQYADDAKAVLDRTKETSLARRDARVAVGAMRKVASWMDPDSEAFGGPSHHEAELIGMEVSGPTHCSSVGQCNKAGMKAFREAARIWEYQAGQAEGARDVEP
ncbi:hypothetical protein SAMN05421509_10731 [Chromohalobacter canadensis]|uniref:Uncharacterized protein n=1 Tax=Chromohalobacter canadensis TaxID=141389 RepID=A0A285VQS3_9GAMM|nr:hypothetical protein [Chromohalobacter canadensis]SOC56420.1 hypothetical protein SAMN05421509_10731 [Chromohalobacter canadensis]